MEVAASLKNLRIAPRKVRLVVDLIRGMKVEQAKAQLPFLVKKSSAPVLKLLNSAVANAKHNFNLEESNLYISKIMVESGPTMKRWMPRAMGRAYPIMKRSSTIKLILAELTPTQKKAKKPRKPRVLKADEVGPEVQEPKQEVELQNEAEPKIKNAPVQRPYSSSTQAKKRHFSRQSFKRIFRRKSI